MNEYEREEALSMVAEEIFAAARKGGGIPVNPTYAQTQEIGALVNVKHRATLIKYKILPWEVVEYLDVKSRRGTPGYTIKKHHGYYTEDWEMDMSPFSPKGSVDSMRGALKSRAMMEFMSDGWMESLVGGFCILGSPPRATVFCIRENGGELGIHLKIYSLTRPFIDDDIVATPEGNKVLAELVQNDMDAGELMLVALTRTDVGEIKRRSEISVILSQANLVTKVSYYLAGEVAQAKDNNRPCPKPKMVCKTKEENERYVATLYGGNKGGQYEKPKKQEKRF